MWTPQTIVPPHLLRTYNILRVFLYIAVCGAGLMFAALFLFPRFEYSFNFRTPQSSKNTLLSPHVLGGAFRTNGKLAPDESLVVHAGSMGDFSDASVWVNLEKKSPLPETILATVRRSFQAFRLPMGQPIDTFPRETLYHVENTYYAFRDDKLIPFVSPAAFRSRYPDAFALPETPGFLTRFPIADTFIGFRPGVLLAFGDGVYVVTSESEIRPIGSAEIFLALGYTFDDVLQASEEDLGIYKRGRIFILGVPHPDGTLFEESDAGTLYLIDQGTKRAVIDPAYREFLVQQQKPIRVSQSGSESSSQCRLVSRFFPRSYTCNLSLVLLRDAAGSDFELTLADSDAAIDIQVLTLSLKTDMTLDNILEALSKIKQRVFRHFGYGL